MSSVRDFLESLEYENKSAIIYDGGVDPTPALDLDDPALCHALEFDVALEYDERVGFSYRERVDFDEPSSPTLRVDTVRQLDELRRLIDDEMSLDTFLLTLIASEARLAIRAA